MRYGLIEIYNFDDRNMGPSPGERKLNYPIELHQRFFDLTLIFALPSMNSAALVKRSDLTLTSKRDNLSYD